MVKGRTSDAFGQVASVFRDGTLAGLSDREILERFVEDRDEAAFEVLLKRHGPMVLNVCRQTLFDRHEVEDAFQATFLALVCKASSIRIEGSLGPWLYRVASRTSARARANRRRRGERERSGDVLPELPTCDDSGPRGNLPHLTGRAGKPPRTDSLAAGAVLSARDDSRAGCTTTALSCRDGCAAVWPGAVRGSSDGSHAVGW